MNRLDSGYVMYPVSIDSKMRSGDFVYGTAYTAITYTIISD